MALALMRDESLYIFVSNIHNGESMREAASLNHCFSKVFSERLR